MALLYIQLFFPDAWSQYTIQACGRRIAIIDWTRYDHGVTKAIFKGGAKVELDVMLFFDKAPKALPLYQAVLRTIRAEFEDVTIKVQKTQIAFSNKYQFAFVSLPKRKVKDCPGPCVLLTFGLHRKLEDPRIFHAVEPYPGRWTHHVIIQREEDVDAQITEWLREAYGFSLSK